MRKLREQMKWIMVVIAITFLFSTFLMYGGRSSRQPSRNADGTLRDYEVAQINGRPLMRSELEARVRDLLQSYGRNVTSVDIPAFYQTALTQAIVDAQLAKEVAELGIRVSDAEADKAMKIYADRHFPTREAFFQTLEMSGVKVEDYKKDVARQIAVQRLYQSVIGDVVVSEDQAIRFYDTMKNLFYMEHPEGFEFYVASYGTPQDAETLRSRLQEGLAWAEAVSFDALSSGDVVNVTPEPVFLPMAVVTSDVLAPLVSLDVGEASPVFSMTSEDFSVAVMTARVSESIRPYEAVSEDIRVMLREQETQQKLTELHQSLVDRAQVEVYDTSLFPKPSPARTAAPTRADSQAGGQTTDTEAR